MQAHTECLGLDDHAGCFRCILPAHEVGASETSRPRLDDLRSHLGHEVREHQIAGVAGLRSLEDRSRELIPVQPRLGGDALARSLGSSVPWFQGSGESRLGGAGDSRTLEGGSDGWSGG